MKGDDPDDDQKRRLLALVVAAAVDVTMASHVYIVGDTIFLQTDGGPIGLELTGALSRPFMMRWDRLYLTKVQEAGIQMLLYTRYVDDSNQIAVLILMMMMKHLQLNSMRLLTVLWMVSRWKEMSAANMRAKCFLYWTCNVG